MITTVLMGKTRTAVIKHTHRRLSLRRATNHTKIQEAYRWLGESQRVDAEDLCQKAIILLLRPLMWCQKE